jgi:tetratricopeptide (TPR) repeat protein
LTADAAAEQADGRWGRFARDDFHDDLAYCALTLGELAAVVGVFARGGDRESTADALLELARADRAGGLTSDAVRRARQAAQLLADEETGEAGVRALLQLGSLCLDTGAPDSAAAAAELARERVAALPEPTRTELSAAAMLLAGIAQGQEGADEQARASLAEARDLLIAARKPAGAALALVQQGVLDVTTERSDGAELCFAYARDFYRNAQLPLASVEVATRLPKSTSGRTPSAGSCPRSARPI